jgi:molybdopterin-containing oxidoreductase family membrane subunit
VGAIFSGIAAIIIAMAVIRWAYHLGNYLKPIHFSHLGIMLLVMSLLWLYFTVSEFLTTFYGHEPLHMKVFNSKLYGPYAPHFWTMCVTCFIIPFAILCNRKTRTIAGTVIASLSVNIGMYLERYIIVVPSLSTPRLQDDSVSYSPTWVEWCILAASLSSFILLYVLFTKFFPIVSIWEVKEGREKAIAEATERIRRYLPSSESPAEEMPSAALPEGREVSNV